MTEPFIGEIRPFSFGFPPKGWAQCNGQLLAINQNQALFALLGTNFGGNGQTTFGLPDLRGRVPLHKSNDIPIGMQLGETNVTLAANHMPSHTLGGGGIAVTSAAGFTGTPRGAILAASSAPVYGTGALTSPLAAGTLGNSSGGGQPHSNQQPFLTINYCIALQGIFPSQN